MWSSQSFHRIVLAGLLAVWSLTAAAAEPPAIRLGEPLERLPAAVAAGARVEVDFERLLSDRSIEIELPEGRFLAAVRERLELRSQGDVMWTGRTLDGEAVVLTVHGGRLAGTVFAAEGVHQIFPNGAGSHEVLSIETGSRPACGGAPHFEDPLPLAESALVSSEAGRAPRIDLLVLYDAESSAAVGSKRNMETVVQHFVDLTNVAFHNSDIETRVRLAQATEVSVPAEVRGNGRALLEWLRLSASIGDLRATHGADLIGLVHEPTPATACGSAAMIYRPGGPGAGLAVFESRRLCGADTFAHEVGHLLGADHNPENAAVAAGEFIYGRGHYHDGLYRTIMSYSNPCGGACPSQPFFSNPAIRHERRATGISGERDNARIIDELAGFVAAFAGGVNNPDRCALEPGDPDYCLECGPCVAGEGSCELDSDCAAGLQCVADSGTQFGLDASVDVCLRRDGCDLDPGDPDYCSLCGPCSFGGGDCDSNRECQEGLTCLDDVGESYGFAASADVCGFRSNGFCPLEPGHPDYCRACGPCAPGEGGCKADSECVTFSECFEGVGAELGFKAGTNVCLRAAPADCPFQPGSAEFCKVCGVCDEGEGDCDTDRECKSGLTCVDGAGVSDFGESIDLCLSVERGGGGGALKAPKRLKARVLSPTRVRLKWKDKSKEEEGFYVEMSREGGGFERIATLEPNKRKLFVNSLESDTTYTFRVQAFNAAGVSDFTREVTVTTP
jgi:hypothetical protein